MSHKKRSRLKFATKSWVFIFFCSFLHRMLKFYSYESCEKYRAIAAQLRKIWTDELNHAKSRVDKWTFHQRIAFDHSCDLIAFSATWELFPLKRFTTWSKQCLTLLIKSVIQKFLIKIVDHSQKVGGKCVNYAKSGNFQWFVPVNLSVITFRCLLSLLVETLSTEMNYNGHKLEKKIIFKNRNVDI